MARQTKRKLLFALHGWCAVPIWAGLLLVCLTGTIATVSQEITWLINPAVRADPSAGMVRLDLLKQTVQQQVPEAVLDDVQIGAAYLAYRVRIIDAEGQRRTLLIDPYTGAYKGEQTGIGFREFMIALHGWLLVPWEEDYSIGWYLVTALSLPLIGSAITGILVTKQFWRCFFRPRVRLHKGARVLWGDLHRLLGVWSVWFTGIIGVTGLWFLGQGILSHIQIPIYPERPVLAQTLDQQALSETPLEDWVRTAEGAVQGLRITYMDLPNQAGEPVTVRGTQPWSLYRDNVTAIYIAPDTKDIQAVQSPASASLLHKTVAILTPLHFGDFAGLLSKLIWFIFGCALCLMITSGFILWSKRTLLNTRKALHGLTAAKKAGKKEALASPSQALYGYGSWIIVLLPVVVLLSTLL
ncbi:PepSY-associated TM helix domain-containing protein [Paremcibacter congregatus]|uniref:PepSY-associated TM helix domain-containing protein n=1 Tax=Paremcibacter congregatus TaxID=2043170 RepID=UPI003A91B0AD